MRGFFPNVNLTLLLPLFRFNIPIQINKPFDPEKSLLLRNINFFLVTGSTLTSKILLKYKIRHRTSLQLPFMRGKRDGEAPRRRRKFAFALRFKTSEIDFNIIRLHCSVWVLITFLLKLSHSTSYLITTGGRLHKATIPRLLFLSDCVEELFESHDRSLYGKMSDGCNYESVDKIAADSVEQFGVSEVGRSLEASGLVDDPADVSQIEAKTDPRHRLPNRTR